MTNTNHPRLRAVDIRPAAMDGGTALLLRDPLQLSEKTVVIPQQLGAALFLCDGTRDLDGLRASLMMRFGLRVSPELVDTLVSALDEAFLLENPRYEDAKRRAVADYRAAPFRPPVLAGQSYPADPLELRALFQSHVDVVQEADKRHAARQATWHGVISPHIDYQRGGPVYAAVWSRAAAAVRDADLVIALGTDHYGSEGAWTLTRQDYATPFGILPTHQPTVDTLADALGEETAFAAELHHRSEHAIELAATWLHFICAGRPCQMVPILCGSFSHFVRGEAHPTEDPAIANLLSALQPIIAGRRTLVVAAGDLSHVGPAFGGSLLDPPTRAQLQAEDETLLQHIRAGDAAGFFAAISQKADQNNVCGLPPIYLTLRLLAPTQGETVAYDSYPADTNDTSAVTVCGTLLT